MNFKERFAGKTTKITKEGDLESNKADFDQPKVGPSRGNSIHKNERASLNESNNDITRNSRLSYKVSEQSNMKKTQESKSFLSKPIEKL